MAITPTPLWKGATRQNTTTADTMRYRICVGSASGPVIYEGKVVRRPSYTKAYVEIGDICADYIQHALPNMAGEFDSNSWGMTFYVQKPTIVHDVETWNTLGNPVYFVNDWSYEDGYDYDTNGLNAPVSEVIERNQYLLVSESASAGSVNVVLHLADGTSLTQVITLKVTADFNDDFNEDWSLFEGAPMEYGAVGILDLSQLSYDIVSIDTPHHHYVIGDNCGRYVLYYVNAYGGWDSLRVKGVENDAYDRAMMQVREESYDHEGRTKFNYRNGVRKSWSLRTGTLTDLGGERMHHLLGSTFVYLHDLRDGKILPVNVTESNCEYKSYKGAGRKRVGYTIGVEYARDRERR